MENTARKRIQKYLPVKKPSRKKLFQISTAQDEDASNPGSSLKLTMPRNDDNPMFSGSFKTS